MEAGDLVRVWAGLTVMEALGAAVPPSFPAAKATTSWLVSDTPAPTEAARIPILSQGSSYSAGLGVRPGASPGTLLAGFGIRDSVTEDGGSETQKWRPEVSSSWATTRDTFHFVSWGLIV